VPPFSITDALRGVCAVTVTPFDRAGELDRRSTARLARHIAQGGVNAITVGGSVGEYMSLTAAEALAVLTETIAAVDGALPVLGATGFDLRSAIERAQAAVAAGAAGVMVHQPHHPFRSAEGWSSYHQRIADELDPSPIVLYINDAGIGPSEIGWLAERCPNIAAVKYAVPDPPRMASLASGVDDRLVWLCGLAERWAPAFWAAGARALRPGWPTSTPPWRWRCSALCNVVTRSAANECGCSLSRLRRSVRRAAAHPASAWLRRLSLHTGSSPRQPFALLSARSQDRRWRRRRQ